MGKEGIHVKFVSLNRWLQIVLELSMFSVFIVFVFGVDERRKISRS